MQNSNWTVLAGEDRHLDPALIEDAGDICRLAFGLEFTGHDWAHTIGGQRILVMEGSNVVGHAAVVARYER